MQFNKCDETRTGISRAKRTDIYPLKCVTRGKICKIDAKTCYFANIIASVYARCKISAKEQKARRNPGGACTNYVHFFGWRAKMHGIRGTSIGGTGLWYSTSSTVSIATWSTLKDIFAVDLAPVADGLAAAGADGFQLLDLWAISSSRVEPGKPRIMKSARAVADDRNAQIDRDKKKQLVGLLGRENWLSSQTQAILPLAARRRTSSTTSMSGVTSLSTLQEIPGGKGWNPALGVDGGL